MIITKKMLMDIGVSGARSDRYLRDLNAMLPKYGINTPLRVAHFLAQVLHESGMLRHTTENMNYSAKGLRKIFSKYFTRAQARSYARKPESIGNRAYANRNGNGSETSGDGHRYRGRGLIQLTGKDNYQKFSDWHGVDVVHDPNSVASNYAVASAVFYWNRNSLNWLADRNDVRAVTKRINGGYNGLQDRIDLLRKAKRAVAASNLSQAPSVAPKTSTTGITQETPMTPVDSVPSKKLANPFAILFQKIIDFILRITGAGR